MKRKLLFAAALVAGALSFEANAQSFADGNYYIQNVESGLYLCGANNWGTRACVAEEGVEFTLTNADGKYSILHTGVTVSNKYLGDNLYTDATNPGWTIAAVEGENGVYTIANGAGYLAQGTEAGLYTGYVTVTTNEITDAAKWYILTKEEAIAKLANATEDNPMSATFLISNPGFNRNISTAGWTMVAGNKNLSGGADNNRCAESWQSTFTLSQAITVPNGYYKVRAQAALTDYTNAYDGTDYPVVYAGDDATVPFNSMDESDRGTNMNTLSNSFTAGKYFTEWTDLVTVTTKSLTIGVKGTRTNTWCIWDNFQLMYYGPLDLSSYKAELDAAIEKAEAIDEKMNAEVATALATAISTYKGKTYDNEEDYGAAIAAVNTAISAANTSVANYASVKSAIEAAAVSVATLDEAGKEAYNIVEVQTAYDEASITDDTYTTYISKIDVAVAAAAKAQTTPGADMTLAIVNPSFETGNYNGWTTATSNDTGARSTSNGTYAMNGSVGNYLFNTWSKGTAITQEITGLQPGKYTVSAVMGTDAGKTFELALNGVKATAESVDKGTGVTLSNTVLVTTGSLIISAGTSDEFWYKVDNFTLTFVEAIALQDYYDEINTLVATAEAITGDQSNATATALSAAVTAGKAASGSETDIDALNKVIADLNAAIEASNASVAAYALGAKLNAIAKDSYYMTSLNAGLDASNNSNLASMTYTAANANTWHTNTWSTEGNSDGSSMTTPFFELWIGGGALLNDATISSQKIEGIAAGHYRISALVRAVNEKGLNGADIAGVNFYANDVVVDLATLSHYKFDALEGNAGIVSAEVDIVEGGSLEFGFNITSQNISWLAFKDVTLEYMPEVEIGYNAYEKGYATFISPNDVPVAENAKAYIVTGVDENDGLVLEEKEGTIPANTPVVIIGNDLLSTIVYSAAKEKTYTVGLLTGTHEEMTAPVGKYVLQIQNGVAGFYKVANVTPTIYANHAYLTYEAPAEGESAKAFFFPGNDATAIEAISALANGEIEAIYTIGGAKVNGLQKGINIVKMQNGETKKVLVK